MQYLGGKSRIAKHIAPIVNAARCAARPYFWDPFCGGLSMAVQLAARGPGIVSDKNAALIALYTAARAGWVPPAELSESEYAAARTLPDSDPRKAFAGFGCSVLGKWFAGFEPRRERSYTKRARSTATMTVDRASAARASLLRDVPKLAQCQLLRADFLSTEPRPWPIVIYADPPYAGTTGYAATGAFDHALFWARCVQWERVGVPVFVSEYACPVPHRELWSRTYGLSASSGRREHTDKLFRVVP